MAAAGKRGGARENSGDAVSRYQAGGRPDDPPQDECTRTKKNTPSTPSTQNEGMLRAERRGQRDFFRTLGGGWLGSGGGLKNTWKVSGGGKNFGGGNSLLGAVIDDLIGEEAESAVSQNET